MAVQLNHLIVMARNQENSARFFTEILGLPAATRFGPFLVVQTANGVSLDFDEAEGDVTPMHYAFLITEAEFDEIFGRIRERRVDYWADPGQRRLGEINRHDGGRGVYFRDPNGHLLEIITRPYGGGQ
ncbi:MAG TPA: VOC family protein [Rhodocyclaceae bacterium]|nr:VOC family protein [Rhodocyclaceae bacterium]